MEIDIRPNQVIHSYRFEHPIGHGSYGVVWKAHHELMDIAAAVKVIPTDQLDDMNLKRIQQECLIGGKLTHKDRVVEVRDAFQHKDLLLIVMELMVGGSLSHYLREHPHPDFALTLDWATSLCRALSEVHDLDVIHRDIKPQNILLTEDAQVKLSDFGISHLPNSQLTTVYQPGTPGYRAPELEDNQPADALADVYSLCAVLFEVWTGRTWLTYRGQKPGIAQEEMAHLLTTNYPALSPSIRQRLVDAVLAGLRPHDARITLSALQEALQTIQADWRRGAVGARTAETARKKIVEHIRAGRQETVISNVPQTPVAGRSRPSGKTALTDWLEEDWGAWYKSSPLNTLILWFDPKREWEPLLDELTPGLNLIGYNDSLLEVRYQIEQRPPDQLVVAYLPLPRDDADYLLPFCFTSYVFEKSLGDVLQEHDIRLPRSVEDRRSILNMLPQLAKASIGKGVSYWQNIRSAEDGYAALIRDFDGQLRQFLDEPVATWESLRRDDRHDAFRMMVAAEFGYDQPMGNPEDYAHRLVVQWCLTHLYVQAGLPKDFPLQHLLPDPNDFDACTSTLEQWRNDRRYEDRFVDYARQVDTDYPNLVRWSEPHIEQIHTPPMPGIAHRVWERMADEIESWQSFEDAVTSVRSNQTGIREMAEGFWSTRGETPGWHALRLTSLVMQGIQKAVGEVQNAGSAGQVLRGYIERWWKIDRDYRLCKDALSSPFPSCQALTGWVDRHYRQFLDDLNQQWSTLLEGQAMWAFPGVISAQEDFWTRMGEGGESRHAVFLVDALRYELGQALVRRLPEDCETDIEPLLGSLPSTTPIGMSALLPDASERDVDCQTQGWYIGQPAFSANLASKAGRTRWLESRLKNARILDLDDLLRPDTEINPQVAWLIVNTTQIDAIGESTGILTPSVLSALLDRLQQGIRRVIQAGFPTVHVATDHGFLLLDKVSDHGKAILPEKEWLKKSARYAIGRSLPEGDHLSFPVSGSSDLVGWFPRGTICFKTPGRYNYVHGGLSLQEVVLPYIRIKVSTMGTPIGVAIEANSETRIAIFKVVLQPVQRGLVPQEREVRLTLEREDGQILSESVELVTPAHEVVKNMRIGPGDNVVLGETLSITVYDARTHERLDRHPIRVRVSMEL